MKSVKKEKLLPTTWISSSSVTSQRSVCTRLSPVFLFVFRLSLFLSSCTALCFTSRQIQVQACQVILRRREGHVSLHFLCRTAGVRSQNTEPQSRKSSFCVFKAFWVIKVFTGVCQDSSGGLGMAAALSGHFRYPGLK